MKARAACFHLYKVPRTGTVSSSNSKSREIHRQMPEVGQEGGEEGGPKSLMGTEFSLGK